MRILVAHNFYQQPGGEDAVFADEVKLLRQRGHAVETFTVHNDALEAMGRLAAARATIWNTETARALCRAVQAHQAHVVHFHNTFPLISPAGYRAARKAGAAVVQTLHNYRLLCPAATFLRQGQVCEQCLGKTIPWPGVAHRCYRGSRGASAALASMLGAHRLLGTYRRAVDGYIALTDFSRNKFIEGGFDPEQIVVKSNFVDPDPGFSEPPGRGVLFVGRLSGEKGIDLLLEAWKRLDGQVPLTIMGDGPLRPQVEAAAGRMSGLCYRGRQPAPQVLAEMGQAALLVFPSVWYEGQPRTIIESLAKGTPVLASDLGSMPEMIRSSGAGALFAPGDAEALAGAVRRLFAEPERLQAMRRLARHAYMAHYTAERNYPRLLHCYRQALVRRWQGRLPDGVSSSTGAGSSDNASAAATCVERRDR